MIILYAKMKQILLILFSLFQSIAFSHDYFFAFAEVDYDDISQRLEATVSASSHDLERLFDSKKWTIDDLTHFSNDKKNCIEISNWLFEQFSMSTNNQQIELSIIGCEVELNGQIHFYIESKPIEILTELTVTFNFLMNIYQAQQNKVTFHFRDQKITKDYLQNSFVHQFRLENS